MRARRSLHYGWLIVAAGTLTVFACIGLGRFALGMLLPSMGSALALSYAEMGWISTANLIGYLLAVFVAGRLIRRAGARATVTAGLLFLAITLMLMAAADGFVAALICFALTGIGSGIANVPVMALVSHWFAPRFRGRAAGGMVAGNGFAIIFAGILVPAVNAADPADGWRTSWLLIGATALAAGIAAGLLLRDRPERLGLGPIGGAPAPLPAAGGGPAAGQDRRLYGPRLLHLGAIYALFGASYVIYATFLVTALVADHGFSQASAGSLWAGIGALSLISGPLFGGLSDRIGRRAGLALVFACQGAAYALAAVGSPPAISLSIVLYGLVAFSIPSIMAAAVGDTFGADRAADAFGAITVIFGLGQICGPVLAGFAAEAAGGFGASFALAAVLALTALGLIARLPRPVR